MNSYKLETVAFLSGALVMILELTGSRVLSPYFGNSIYIWTGMIGVILGFLSLGYYYGGIIADKGASLPKLAKIIWYAGVSTFLIATFKEPILQFFAAITSGDIKTGSVLSIIFLFGPVAVLLGCVTPIVIKLKLDNFKNLGKDVGKIYALSTIGSIFGTFLSGYTLIPLIGNTNLIYTVAVILITISLWVSPKLSTKKIIILILFVYLYYLRTFEGLFKISSIADIDTIYNRILIRDVTLNNKSARVFMTDRLGIQSAIYPEHKSELASEYAAGFASITKALPKTSNSLIVGGAGFVFPSYFISNELGYSMDVVEIDPEMIDLAKKYFFFNDLNNLNIFTDDARHFIKKTNSKYDLIFLDAFNSIAPPHHLTTVNFFSEINNKMTAEGKLVVNLVGSISGKNSAILSWQYSTLKHVFEKVEVYKVFANRSDNQIQNIILLAYKNPNNKLDISKLPKNMTQLDTIKLGDKQKILTDDFAPVEHLASGFMGGN